VALLRLARGPFAAAAVRRDPSSLRRLVERLPVAVKRVDVGIVQSLGVVLAAHPEVREVVEVAAEDVVAVLVVGPGVEDVLVPDLVDKFAGDDVGVGIGEVESQNLRYSCSAMSSWPSRMPLPSSGSASFMRTLDRSRMSASRSRASAGVVAIKGADMGCAPPGVMTGLGSRYAAAQLDSVRLE
jgi:hypothetical protein